MQTDGKSYQTTLPPSAPGAWAPVYFLAFMCFSSSVSPIHDAMMSATTLVRTNTIPLISLSSRCVSRMISFSFSRRGFSSHFLSSTAKISKFALASTKEQILIKKPLYQIVFIRAYIFCNLCHFDKIQAN